MMQPSNNPDTALAQEWVMKLDDWLCATGLRGYDPFDVKAHRWLRAAQPHPFRRRVTSVLCDRFPYATRRMLGISPSEHPKAYALGIMAALKLFALLEDEAYLHRATHYGDWLLEHAITDHAGMSWGHPFPIYAQGLDVPAKTPITVVTATAGEALIRLFEATGDDRWREAAHQVGNALLETIPRLPQKEGMACFAYGLHDARRVHNANLMAAEFLARMGKVYTIASFTDAAMPALAFSLAGQQEDGAWPYGEIAPEEPFEAGLMHLVDHHHTGFVLRSLHALQTHQPSRDSEHALAKGFQYYRKLFTKKGLPQTAQGLYPIDIHACAEGILCPSLLSERFPNARPLAVACMRSSFMHMRHKETYLPYYRKHRRFTATIPFPRWGGAWMHYALTEFLFHFHTQKDRVMVDT